MNVAQMIEWLKTQDQEAIVGVVYHTSGSSYYDQGGNATSVEFDPNAGVYSEGGDQWDYKDFRGNQFVKEDAPYYNKRYLRLGGLDQ